MRNAREEAEDSTSRMGQRYEAVFCVFLVVLAFLWRDNPHLVYPEILYLFVLLLGLNLAAGISFRLWPTRSWISASFVLLNCAAIAAILSHSGGADSNLWVLFLLPIYTACMLLGGREVVWITLGAAGFNLAFQIINDTVWTDAVIFLIAVKSGIFIFAAAITYRIVRRDRDSASKLSRQRGRLLQLEKSVKSGAENFARAQHLAEAGMASSGVAHDLKTPLLVILGTAELIEKRNGFSAEFKQDIERIKRSAILCKKIVSNVLGLIGKKSFSPRRCGINGIVGNSADLYRSMLIQHGISLITELARDLPDIEADPYELQRLILNLMSNAKDAIEGKGSIAIRTGLEAAHGAQPPAIEVSVRDSGPGIPESAVDKLFEAFVTSKAEGQGTGLGLYLCREIAHRHGGSLRAENPPGGGARFILSLPVAAPAGQPVPEEELTC